MRSGDRARPQLFLQMPNGPGPGGPQHSLLCIPPLGAAMSGPRSPGPGEAALRTLLGDLIGYYREEAGQGRLRVCRQAALTHRARQVLGTGGPPGLQFPESMATALGGCSQADPGSAQHICPELVRALEFLELISVNLLLFPWRKEIRSLKTFTGSFAYWVRPVLSQHALDTMLHRLGYTATSESEFSLVQSISEEDTKQMVFEIFLTRVTCEAFLGTTSKQVLGPGREKLSRPHCRPSSGRGPAKGTQPGPGLATPQQGPPEGAASGGTVAKGTGEQSSLPGALRLPEASAASGGLPSGPLAPSESQRRTSTCSDSEEFLTRYSDLALHQTPLFPRDLPLGSLKGHQLQGPAPAPQPSSGEVVTPSGSSSGVTIPDQLCLIPGLQSRGESWDPKPEAEVGLATRGTDSPPPGASAEMDELGENLSHLLGSPTLAGPPRGSPGPGAEESRPPEPLVGPEPASGGSSPDSRGSQLWRSTPAPSHVREPPSSHYIPPEVSVPTQGHHPGND